MEAPASLDFAIVNGTSDHRVSCMDLRANDVVGYVAEDGTRFAPAARPKL